MLLSCNRRISFNLFVRVASLSFVLATVAAAIGLAPPAVAQEAPAIAPPPAKLSEDTAPADASGDKTAGDKAAIGDKDAAADHKLFDYREITLPNGLRVITLEDFSCPIVEVQVWYHVGSKDEQPERQGFAHMFEHMMFRGTERLGPKEHFDLIRRAGGDCNAYTSFDQTVYHETLAAHQLELALWLEADRMSGLKIDQNSFDTERKVVEEERRIGLNRPFGTVFEKVMAEVFQAHPYRWTPIGSIPHLRASSVPELRDFWTRYYVPNNATLVIVGAVKHAEAQQLAKRHFGWIAKGEDPPRVKIDEPWPSTKRLVKITEKNVPAPLAGVIFRTVPLKHPDHVPLALLARILVGEESSRLYRALVVDKKLAVEAIDISEALEQDGLFFAGAILSPANPKMADATAALEAEIEKLRTGPISEHELLKARNQALKKVVTQTLTVEGKAAALGEAAVLEGDPGRANDVLDDIRRVTIDDLHRVAMKYLVPEHQINVEIVSRGLSGLIPGKKEESEDDAPITAKPELKAPPPGRPGVTRPANFFPTPPLAVGDAIELPSLAHSTKTLENGLKVIVVPNHEVPYISVTLGLLSGAWTDVKPGSASMTLDMLTKGTAKHDEEQIADELGTYAIGLSGNSTMDSATVTANCLTDQLERAVGLLGEVVREPNFPEGPFADLREQTLTGLAISSKEPGYIADRELRRKLYGKHPYARSSSGEVSDVEALAPADLVAWWRTNARPDNAVLIFSGDIDEAQAVKLAESALGDWKATAGGDEPLMPVPPAAATKNIVLVDFPGSTQSQIRVGQLGITRHDPRYPATRVVDNYFGGAFSSRLNETIRVKRGLTYGASGGFHPRRFSGEFTVDTFSRTETAAEALSAVFEEIQRLRTEGPSTDELANSKAYLINSFPLDRETPQQLASALWRLEVNALPQNFYEQELRGVAQTSNKNCLELVDDLVHPDHMTAVVVGNAKELKEGLEKIAPVTVIEAKE